MERVAIGLMKAAISLLLALSVVGQVLVIPMLAAEVAREFPEAAHLRWPGILGCGAIVLCAQVVLICIWRLLTLTAKHRVFSGAAFTYVRVMIAACWTASLLLAAALVILSVANATPPGAMVLILIGGTTTGSVALLLTVMLSLLHQATRMRAELEEVI